MHNQCRNS